jgi:DNA-binding transcriptional ArsR family regulator
MVRMHALDVLGDRVRRRILEILADGESGAGAITATIRSEFGISQPAVSQHLRVLREEQFVSARVQGPRRLYTANPDRLAEAEGWFTRFHTPWRSPFDALGTEIARGKRERRRATQDEIQRKDAS